jgi:tripartite-type tricarboxylate transporter receptor subunit TctC
MFKHFVIAAAMLFSSLAYAQEKITIYTRVPLGETTSVITAAMIKEMNSIFENKYEFRLALVPGAGGEANDGRALTDANSGANVIVAGSLSAFAMNPVLFNSKLNRDVNFVPTELVSVFPNALMVNPNSNINTMEDLVKQIKSKPKAFVASTDQATTSNLMAAAFIKRYGTPNLSVIKYKRPGEITPSVLQGETDFGITNPIDTHGLKLLAVSTKSRSPNYPSVPTGLEMGFTEFDYTLSLMLYIPTINKEFINSVKTGIHEACLHPNVKATADTMKMTMVCENNVETLRRDIKKMQALVEEHKDAIK